MSQADERTRQAETLLPLKPAVYLILLALVPEELHGYAIKKRVEELSDGRMQIDPGTLYRWMARFLSDGWVIESNRRPAPLQDDQRRRYYGLTPLGRRIVELESARLSQLVDQARRWNLVRGGGTR